ncbi:DMT family transporter [Patescibacteria group bacterium]|nr:DMT family transporter [Patescibacteria group bacterium]
MKKLSRERTGEAIILSESIVWGLFPILVILSSQGLAPITALAWTTGISILFFAIVIILRKSWKPIWSPDILFKLSMIALITGIILYVLYYIGLQHTTAGNAAIIGTSEILFSYLFFNVWKKEYMSATYITGATLMFLGVVVVLSPNFHGLQIGDLLIVLAMMVAPLGNHFQKGLRADISSEQILLFRTIIATPVLFVLAWVLGESVSIPSMNLWWAILINGFIMFGLTKILWIESIYRLGVTKAISLSSVSPIFTLVFAYIIFKDQPTLIQIIAVPLSILGIYLLTRPVKKTT